MCPLKSTEMTVFITWNVTHKNSFLNYFGDRHPLFSSSNQYHYFWQRVIHHFSKSFKELPCSIILCCKQGHLETSVGSRHSKIWIGQRVWCESDLYRQKIWVWAVYQLVRWSRTGHTHMRAFSPTCFTESNELTVKMQILWKCPWQYIRMAAPFYSSKRYL